MDDDGDDDEWNLRNAYVWLLHILKGNCLSLRLVVETERETSGHEYCDNEQGDILKDPLARSPLDSWLKQAILS